jgi:hypothetical protein
MGKDLATRTKVIAVLAVISAIISMYVPSIFELGEGRQGEVPGLAFGAVIAFAMYQAGIRDKLQLGLVVLLTLCVWILATSITAAVVGFLNTVTTTRYWRDIFDFLIGGLVGGLGMFLVTAFTAKQLRRAEVVLWMAAAGAACALPAFVPNFASFLLVFLIFQVAIAVIVVRELG